MDNRAIASGSTTAKPAWLDQEKEQNQRWQRLYSCPHCPRKFSCSHALGGHINGHRSEKYKPKRMKRSPSNGGEMFITSAPFPPRATPLVPPSHYLSWMKAGLRARPLRPERKLPISAFQTTTTPPELIDISDDSDEIVGVQQEQVFDLNVTPTQIQEGLQLNLRSPQPDLQLKSPLSEELIDLTLKL